MRGPLRGFLAGFQIVVALVLLSVAVWLLQGFREQMTVFARLEPAGILPGRVALPNGRYPDGEAPASFFSRLLEEASEIPGVSSAALTANLPASNVPNEDVFFAVEGREPATEAERPRADLQVVGGDFFDLFRVPRRGGRFLEPSDHSEAPAVVVVSESWARRYLGDGEPLGRRLRFGPRDAEGDWFRIVGIVGDVKQNWFDPEPRPTLYVSHLQVPRSRMRRALRSCIPGYGLVEPLREKLAGLDPHQALAEPTTLEDEIADSLAPLAIIGFLLLFFAGVALLLSASGVYGVVSASVSERRRELGLRMALGARAPQVLRETLRLTAIDMGVALPATSALNVALSGRLFGLVAVGPGTLGATALGLISMAAVAAYVPARAATRLDPVTALRWE